MSIRREFIKQVDARDCGVAALASIARHYGSYYSLAELRQLAGTTIQGTTALGLVQAGKELGFEVRAIQADRQLFEMKELVYPFIAHVIKEGTYPHYYVVYQKKGNKLLIGDPNPSVGVCRMSFSSFEKEWTGVTLLFTPSSSYHMKKREHDGIASLLPLVFRQYGLIIQIVLASLFITLIGILGSYYLRSILDDFIPNHWSMNLTIVSIGLIFLYILQQILNFVRDITLTILGQRFSIDLILSYIRHLFSLPLSFFATRRTGELTSRFTDAQTIIDALASTILTLFLDLATIILIGTFLFFQESTLFFITLLALPFYAVFVLAFIRPFQAMNQKVMQTNASLSSAIIEDIKGIETIKSLDSQERRFESIDTAFVKFLHASYKLQKYSHLQFALKKTTQLVLQTLVLWWGARLVIQGQFSAGQLFSYQALLLHFTTPIENLLNLQGKLQAAKVATQRLHEVFLVESEGQDRPKDSLLPLTGKIDLQHLSFQYGYGPGGLKEISLSIPPGQKICLVGLSGSGKTTLAKIIADLYPATSGSIKLDDYTYKHLSQQTIRQTIHYVPQDTYLFKGTILENLALARKEPLTQQEIIEACRLAGILEDIEALPMGFFTQIEESSNLSGGQRQRLAIARALLSPAPVLIFDEATSALDVRTEKEIVDGLLTIKERTIIFVAHRLTIARSCQMIHVLDKGKLLQSGTHQILLQEEGLYKELWKKAGE